MSKSTKDLSYNQGKSVCYSQTEPSTNPLIKSSKTGPSFIHERTLRHFDIISSNVNNPRYLGMSEYQSENSLQNSSYCWSFPKGLRFNSTKAIVDKMYALPKLSSTRTTGFGIGSRKDLRPRAGALSPSPDTYKIKSCFDYNLTHNKGVKVLERINQDKLTKKANPGPGAYSVFNRENKLLIPIKIKSRLGFFYDEDIKKTQHCISMQKYHPKDALVKNARFEKITFGIGNRTPTDNTYVKSNPGPGSYKVIGCFDKGLKNKLVLN